MWLNRRKRPVLAHIARQKSHLVIVTFGRRQFLEDSLRSLRSIKLLPPVEIHQELVWLLAINPDLIALPQVLFEHKFSCWVSLESALIDLMKTCRCEESVRRAGDHGLNDLE